MTARRAAVKAAVTTLKAVTLLMALTVLACVVVAGAVDGHTGTAVTRDETPIAWERGRVERLMVEHECSTTGFGADRTPGSALISRDTEVRHVSFDHGWAVFTGKREGTLLAVCLDDLA